MYQLNNYLLSNSASKLFDYRIATGESSYKYFTATLDFGITYCSYHLCLQAKSFSDEMFSRSNIRFDIVTGTRSVTLQKQKLEQAYVYSYAKSLYYGVYCNDVNFVPTLSPVFVGHGIFSKMIERSEFKLVKGDFSLYLNLKITAKQKKDIFKQLFKDYSWLSKCVGLNASGGKSFRNVELDRVLSKLCDEANNIVSKRNYRTGNSSDSLKGTSTSDNSLDRDSSEGDKTITEDSTYDKDKGNLSLKNKNTRFVEIYPLDSPDLYDFLDDASLPLGNSAIDISDKNSWYYTCDRDNNIRFSLSHFICRANFIYLLSPLENYYHNLERFMGALPRDYEHDFLILEDVRSITYLKMDASINFDDCEFKNVAPEFTGVAVENTVQDSLSNNDQQQEDDDVQSEDDESEDNGDDTIIDLDEGDPPKE